MNIKEIKEKLPPVQVKYNGKIYTGRIIGRKLDFPTVYIEENQRAWSFSWQSIERAINTNKYLIAE